MTIYAYLDWSYHYMHFDSQVMRKAIILTGGIFHVVFAIIQINILITLVNKRLNTIKS